MSQGVKSKFPLGIIAITRGVADLIDQNSEFGNFVLKSLGRHRQCDWGNVIEGDKKLNDQALITNERVLSAYNDDRFPKNGVATIWIITEHDKSVTTVLFPDEY